MKRKRRLLSVTCLLIALVVGGCGGGDSATSNTMSADTRADAEEILTQMDAKLKSVPAFSFTTSETADRLKRGGEMVKLNINRNVTFKSPDRMYFKTTGDRELEAFYDGKDMTLVSHKDKVWGKLAAPPTINETIDKITEHYGMPMPIADLLGLDAKGRLRNPANTGGIERKETVEGVEYNVLAFTNPDVKWEVWIPVSGDPLPKKLHTKYKTAKGQPEMTFEFSDWNLAPQISDDTFVAKVPDDYEGIPIIQRAAAVIPKIEEAEKRAAASPNANTVAPAESDKK